MKQRVLSITTSIYYFLLVTTAHATSSLDIKVSKKTTDDDLVGIIQGVGDAILAVAGALAVVMLIIGGVRYIISAGNSDQIAGAKKTIEYAIAGVIIVALAAFALRLIQSFF